MQAELRVFYFERSRDLNREIKKAINREPIECGYDFQKRAQDFYFNFEDITDAEAAAKRLLPLRKQYPRRIYVSICAGALHTVKN